MLTYIASVIITLIVIHWFIKFIYSKFSKVDSIHSRFIIRLLNGIFVVIGVILIGQQFEWSEKLLNVITTSSSLLVAVLGFAAQESLSNIINGVFISIFKPFEIGDRIKLLSNNITGTIEDISLRHTVIKTFNNSRVIVPNSVINKEMIENSHFKDNKAGNFLDIIISYDSDIELAMTIMSECIASHPLFIDMRTEEDIEKGEPLVQVLIRDLNESGVNLRANIWTDNVATNFKACSDLRLAILGKFKDNGINVPYKSITIN